MKLASRASRSGLTVGFLRILCNRLCTTQRFLHRRWWTNVSSWMSEWTQLSLPFQRMPSFSEYVYFCSGQATVLPRRSSVTQVFLQSLQYGIVVIGFIDTFVYAHHQHRRSIDNPGNFGDCMKGSIRFMTAITSTYAHAYQATCLTRHISAVPRLNFRLPKPKARYPHLPNVRITTREGGNDFQGWPSVLVDRYTSHVIFLMRIARVWLCESHHLAQVSVRARHPISMPSMVSGWLFLVVFSFWLSPCISPSPCSSLSISTCTLSWTSSSLWTTPRQTLFVPPPTEESYFWQNTHLRQVHEPKLLDDFNHPETTEMIFQEASGDTDTDPSYDAERDDEIIGKALSSPLFIQEREEPADRRQAYHSHEESLLPTQSFFAHPRTGRPVHELSSCQKRKWSR